MNYFQKQYEYGGIRFKEPEDFEKAFKPSKWSIRKFMSFLISLNILERDKFVKHTTESLSDFYSDKDTSHFLQRLRDKTRYSLYSYEKPKIVAPGRDNDLIQAFAQMKKEGIIISSATQLAILLKNEFGVKHEISTIRDKIYKEISFS